VTSWNVGACSITSVFSQKSIKPMEFRCCVVYKLNYILLSISTSVWILGTVFILPLHFTSYRAHISPIAMLNPEHCKVWSLEFHCYLTPVSSYNYTSCLQAVTIIKSPCRAHTHKWNTTELLDVARPTCRCITGLENCYPFPI